MTKTMTAKFPGTCTTCKGRIEAGALIIWTLGKGATHANPDTCSAHAAAKPVTISAPATTINAAGIVAFLTAARARGLKFPAVRFGAPRGGELRLSLAGAGSKYPGAVQVKIDEVWIGRVEASGAVAGRDLNAQPDVIAELNAIAIEPAAKAAAYGKLTGRCSFCEKKLSDDRSGSSIEVGYGPVCAKRYGLPHAPKGAAKVLAVVPGIEPTAATV